MCSYSNLYAQVVIISEIHMAGISAAFDIIYERSLIVRVQEVPKLAVHYDKSLI